MARTPRPWFRLYAEVCGDLKMRRLTPTQRWIWVSVLAAACASPTPGELRLGEEPMTHEDLAVLADVPLKQIAPALTQMVKLGMITEVDGVLVVRNWKVRQFENDVSTGRVRAFRERSKEQGETVSSPFQERVSNRPETETETETEKREGARKRGTRLEINWKPSEADIEWQRENKISDLVARRETEKFRDHWSAVPGSRGVKLDWSATWRNWMRRAAEHSTPAAKAPTFGGW